MTKTLGTFKVCRPVKLQWQGNGQCGFQVVNEESSLMLQYCNYCTMLIAVTHESNQPGCAISFVGSPRLGC